jgi:predicted permease
MFPKTQIVGRGRWLWAEQARQDLGHASRGLRRAPGLTVAATAVLALGLGANGALFSLLDRIFLATPTGVDAPREIRRLYYIHPQSPFRAFEPANGVTEPVDYPEYAAIRASAPDVQFAAYNRPDSVDTRINDGVVPAMASYVTRSYFTTLRVRPARGRFFVADEDQIDVIATAAVISDAFWRRAFARDSGVLGKQIHIRDRTYSVVGVAPPGFDGIDLDRAELWLPLGALPLPPFWSQPMSRGGFHVLRVIARIPSDISETRTIAAATAAYRHSQETANFRDSTSKIVTGPILAALGPSEREQEVSVSLRLAGVSLILLVIAVANVANLMLVRGMRRRREIAIRRALGVSTARLCMQLITESLVLSTLGAASAVIVGLWGSSLLRALLVPEIHWAGDSRVGWLIAFTALASVVVGTLAGTAPALYAAGLDVTSALKGIVKSRSHGSALTRSALMIAQVALSTALLVGAGLFVRSLHNVRTINLGFDPGGLVSVRANYLDLAQSREVFTAFETIEGELSRVPGVRRVALTSQAPMQGSQSTRLFLPGRDSVPSVNGIPPLAVFVSPEYFSAVGLPLVSGRVFEPTDRAGSTPVAVVGRTMAKLIWPGENPIGKCILTFARTEPCTTVVGVVDDMHTDDIIERRPFMQLYLPFAQNRLLDSLRFGMRGIGRGLIIRVRPGTENAVMNAALRIVRKQLPGADNVNATDMIQVLAPKLRPWRLAATLFSALSILAAVVAAVGVYSVVAYATSQRAQEMSIRMALGARAQDILTLITGEGARILGISIAIGIIAAATLQRAVASLLYGVSTLDPLVLASVAVLITLMGFAAMLAPAIRAARNDPSSTLRAE